MSLRLPWMPEIEDEHDAALSHCEFCPEPIRIDDELVWWPVGMGDANKQAHRACWLANA